MTCSIHCTRHKETTKCVRGAYNPVKETRVTLKAPSENNQVLNSEGQKLPPFHMIATSRVFMQKTPVLVDF